MVIVCVLAVLGPDGVILHVMFCKQLITINSVLDSSRMKHPFGDVLLSKVSNFMKKYFLEGQKLDDKQKHALETLPSDAPWTQKMLVRHRRLIGILIPLCFFELFWWMQVRWKDISRRIISKLIYLFRHSSMTIFLYFLTDIFFVLRWFSEPQLQVIYLLSMHVCVCIINLATLKFFRNDKWGRRSSCFSRDDISSWNQTCSGQRFLVDDSIMWYLKWFRRKS